MPLRRTLPRRLRLTAALLLTGIALAPLAPVHADLDNQLFTSSTDRIKLTVPKGWRASEQPSYPGIVLWMLRSQPEGRIVVGVEPLRHELFCSWPPECRTLSQPLAARYACALRAQLERQNFLLGPVQAGPKENAAAGLQSVWFELTDGKRFVRQAIAANERRVVSLALSTGSAADRATHARAFDQALRSLRELTQTEADAVDAAAAEAAARTTPSPTAPAAPDAASPAVPAPPTSPPPPTTPPTSSTPSTSTPPASSTPAPTTPATTGASRLPLPLFDPAIPCETTQRTQPPMPPPAAPASSAAPPSAASSTAAPTSSAASSNHPLLPSAASSAAPPR